MKNVLLLCFVFPVLIGCQPIENRHGFEFDEASLKQLVIQKDTQETVAQKLGHPNHTSLFSEKGKNITRWYYMANETSYVAFYDRKILKQKIVVLSFAVDGLLVSVEEKKAGEGCELKVDAEKTEVSGYPSNVFREIFGGVGNSLQTKTDKK